jgi:hypothetical protein
MVKIEIVPTSILDPMFREGPKRHTPWIGCVEPDDNDVEVPIDLEEEPCAVCDKSDCQDHLLARIDESGDEGECHVGLVGGTLFDVGEIGSIVEKLSAAWVKWRRSNPKAPAPTWIAKEPILLDFFTSLNETPSNKIEDYRTDEDAASNLLEEAGPHITRIFVEDLCFRCGWGRYSSREYGLATYSSIYDKRPNDVADKIRTMLQDLIKLADATP